MLNIVFQGRNGSTIRLVHTTKAVQAALKKQRVDIMRARRVLKRCKKLLPAN